MQEFHRIIEALKQRQGKEQLAVLATVVNVDGSTYRQPGARMLILSDGQSFGTMSGGCLEKDVIERAQQVFSSGEPIVIHYDTTAAEDVVWGLGLGCNGAIHVLIEPIQLNNNEYLAFLSMCLEQQRPGVLATIVLVGGGTHLRVGDRLILHPNYAVTSTIKEPALVQAILADAYDVLQTQRYDTKSYLVSGGLAEVFIEVIQPPTPLVIFGAGHDVLPVIRFANLLGWHTTVIDPRCLEVSRERFCNANDVILARPGVSCEQTKLSAQTVALVMTHNYLHDQEILKSLLPSPVRYVGVLGPKRRTDRLLQDLNAENVLLTEAQLNRLHSPIGVDIGAETPEEIALSIVSEIKAVLTGRSSGFLKDRKGPIHRRMQDEIRLNTVYVDGILMDV